MQFFLIYLCIGALLHPIAMERFGGERLANWPLLDVILRLIMKLFFIVYWPWSVYDVLKGQLRPRAKKPLFAPPNNTIEAPSLAGCDHHTLGTNLVSAFGEWRETTMPKGEDGTYRYCHACLSKMAIRCTWCAKPIFIGDPVTLYISPDKQPAHATRLCDDPTKPEFNSFVGCLRWGCASSGADRQGFWFPGEDGKGRVERVSSPIELAIQSHAAGGKGVVIAHNVANMGGVVRVS